MNPKNAIKILVILVGLVIVGFIAYSMATNSFTMLELQTLETTESVSKSVGASLIFTYIVGGVAVLAVVYSGISNIF